MRNMIQLLGGIAVAGAVAAGSTAFTASGLTNTISGPTVVGGKIAVAQDVEGADLTGIVFDTDATNPDRVTGATVTFAGQNGATVPDGSTVKVVVSGSAGNSAAGFYCAPTTSESTTCTVGQSAGTPTGSWYTALTDVSVSLVAA
ncbi:hypothetical protein OHA21_42485 [Actinoplanes sp. NBC_00393]|uniref:hypothetical protein n=1 Tax=Actinoplanes sp. NBC_00393 TaxID=2975953 RepID=UPI002E1F6C83